MDNRDTSLPPGEVYARIGRDGFARLVTNFYQQVAEDELLRPMYPKGDLQPAARRLQMFLEQYFGGPDTYSQRRGHPRLRARHARFPIDRAARERWMALMRSALDDVDFPGEVRAAIEQYLENAATFMINRPPDEGGMFTTRYSPSDITTEE